MPTAASAMRSVCGFAHCPTNASTACVSASMPVAAVTSRGNPVISAGSSAAIAGTSRVSAMTSLRLVSGSETTAATVTSDPVPAVVGTAYSGSGPRSPLKYPTSLRGCLRLATACAIVFAASIGEPPPNATTASHPCFSQNAMPFSITGIGASGVIASNTTYAAPPAFNASSRPRSRPFCATTRSVTTSTFR